MNNNNNDIDTHHYGYFDTSNVDPKIVEQVSRHVAGVHEGLARMMILTFKRWKKAGLSDANIIETMRRSYRVNPHRTSIFKDEDEFIDYVKKRLADMDLI